MQAIETGPRLRKIAADIAANVPKYLLIDVKTKDGESHPCPLKFILEKLCHTADKVDAYYISMHKTLSVSKRALSIAELYAKENADDTSQKLLTLVRMIVSALTSFEIVDSEDRNVVTTIEDGRVVVSEKENKGLAFAQHVNSNVDSNESRRWFGRGIEIDLLGGYAGNQ